MFTKLVQSIKNKIAARRAIMVFPRKIEKYNSQVALHLARLSQWAYPGGLCTNQDYKDEREFLKDMEKKKTRFFLRISKKIRDKFCLHAKKVDFNFL